MSIYDNGNSLLEKNEHDCTQGEKGLSIFIFNHFDFCKTSNKGFALFEIKQRIRFEFFHSY